jgi:hypothetical protein
METRFHWHDNPRDPGPGMLVRACSECQGLKDGTRSDQDPHEYLLHVGHSDSSPDAEVYRCLVCDSTLMLERDGALLRWS